MPSLVGSDMCIRDSVYYYCADGNDEARTGITLSAQSRFTIPVHEVGLGIGRHNNSHSDFSIKVESADGVPIVAERSMYFSYRPSWTGGHDVVGATTVSYTHLRAHETRHDLVCRLLL